MGIFGFQSGLESLPTRIRTQYWRIATTAPSPTRGGEGRGTVLRLFNCKGDEMCARVMLNLFQHRQIEVDMFQSRRRKREFHVFATLKRVQGDEMGALSFRTCFGIARLK